MPLILYRLQSGKCNQSQNIVAWHREEYGARYKEAHVPIWDGQMDGQTPGFANVVLTHRLAMPHDCPQGGKGLFKK